MGSYHIPLLGVPNFIVAGSKAKHRVVYPTTPSTLQPPKFLFEKLVNGQSRLNKSGPIGASTKRACSRFHATWDSGPWDSGLRYTYTDRSMNWGSFLWCPCNENPIISGVYIPAPDFLKLTHGTILTQSHSVDAPFEGASIDHGPARSLRQT